ncbi:MAG TPA: kelch repeat-containing protein [Gaiellaceae bacterium]|jgi:N-acetylneuraminic acid mutarotase
MRLAVAALVAALGLGALLALPAPSGERDEPAPWSRAASMPQRRSYIAGAELGGLLYAAGGMVGETGRPLATVTRYDPASDSWQTVRPLPQATRAAAGAAVADRVFVVGGTTAAGNTAAVWAYDPARDRWSPRAPLPEPRYNHSAVALDGRLYVLGGLADRRPSRDVFVYSPGENRWRRTSPLPRALHAFGAVAFAGELWVLGGRRGERVLRTVFTFDPETGDWRHGPAMARPMELLGADTSGDEIHAVWESTYQIYNASTGAWRDGPSLATTRHALEAFAVDGVLYTIGGCTTALRDSPAVERRPIEA